MARHAAELHRPVPVLGIHGGADPYVLLGGGWGEGAGSLMLEDVVPLRTTWTCPPGGDVELVVITEGGHAWPVTPVAATGLIWDFFSRHALPAGP